MIQPKFPGGLAPISDLYDIILCDVWGVIHNGRHAFEAACEALVRFRDRGGAVLPRHQRAGGEPPHRQQHPRHRRLRHFNFLQTRSVQECRRVGIKTVQ